MRPANRWRRTDWNRNYVAPSGFCFFRALFFLCFFSFVWREAASYRWSEAAAEMQVANSAKPTPRWLKSMWYTPLARRYTIRETYLSAICPMMNLLILPRSLVVLEANLESRWTFYQPVGDRLTGQTEPRADRHQMFLSWTWILAATVLINVMNLVADKCIRDFPLRRDICLNTTLEAVENKMRLAFSVLPAANLACSPQA